MAEKPTLDELAEKGRRCTACGDEKPLEAFHHDRHDPEGRTRQCAGCRNSVAQERRELTLPARVAARRARAAEKVATVQCDAERAADAIPALFAAWFVGFTDGEGTFEVAVSRPRTGVNAGARFPVVRFSVCQHARDQQVLEVIRDTFGFGRIYPNAYGRMRQWRVIRQADLEVLALIVQRHPLRTAKADDAAIWQDALRVKRLFLGGGSAHGGTNDLTWRRFEALAGTMRDLRATRRTQPLAPASRPDLRTA